MIVIGGADEIRTHMAFGQIQRRQDAHELGALLQILKKIPIGIDCAWGFVSVIVYFAQRGDFVIDAQIIDERNKDDQSSKDAGDESDGDVGGAWTHEGPLVLPCGGVG